MFNGIWLVAVEPLTIQGRSVPAGERFHISRVHAGALLVTGRATIAQPQPPPKASAQATPAPPMPTRRRGRPRKTDVADTPPVAPEIPSEPDVPRTPEHADGQEAPDGGPDGLDGQTRAYRRRDLEAEP